MYCPNCGKEYTDGQNFCRYCGYSLAVKTDEVSSVDLTIANEATQDMYNNSDLSTYQKENTKESAPSVPVDTADVVCDEEEHDAYNKKLIDKKKRLTPKAIALITIVIVFFFSLSTLLWSIDVETQIAPTSQEEYDNDYEINAPSDEDNSIYAKQPENQESHAVQIVTPEEPPVINENEHQKESTGLELQEPSFEHEEEPVQDKSSEDLYEYQSVKDE